MKLKNEIQKSMILVLVTTLLIVYATVTLLVYRQTEGIVEDELSQEADYIAAAVEISGERYLKEMDGVRENTRITLISGKGDVLYDSERNVDFENHSERPEIIQALRDGRGSDVRRSDSLDQEMFYYALRLSDGSVLRVSKTMNSVARTAMGILPAMGLIAVVMILAAVWMSGRQVRKLIRPLNSLDLEDPLENEVYAELTPLLERIDEQNRQKAAVADMRKEFSANVSHELKTPLTSISGYAEIMKDGLVKPEDVPAFSERIYSEASRLVALIGDIMELSRLDEGAAGLEREDVDLYEMTREVMSRLAPQAQAGGIHVEIIGEDVVYRGIRQVLDEIIYNVCENAIKYNKKGGAVKIWVGDTLRGAKVVVEDSGIGIPEDQKDRIFERFYRVDKSHSRETGGTGLGLSIVKHGAILHGAQISVDSEIGRGTRMEILFPAA